MFRALRLCTDARHFHPGRPYPRRPTPGVPTPGTQRQLEPSASLLLPHSSNELGQTLPSQSIRTAVCHLKSTSNAKCNLTYGKGKELIFIR